jgi:membrane fusion protein (multidrug efflux system)
MSNTTTKNNLSSKIVAWGIGAVAIGVVVYGLNHFFNFNTASYTDDAQVQQLISPVNARVGGYIQEVRFTEFQKVKKGDTLVIIDNTDYLAQKELAEAGLMDAVAGKTVTNSSVNTAQNSVNVSDANIEETKARLWNAEKNYSRYKKLLQEESVTQQQFDQVKSEYDALKARVVALESAKQGANLSVNEVGARVHVNEAAIKRAKAQLAIAELNLKYTIVVAPCDGQMGRKNILEGSLVQQGQQLATVVDNSNKWITANFKEKQLASVKQGQTVRIKIDALPNTVLTGTVENTASATGSVFSLVPTDNATGNFVKVQQRIPVRIVFSNTMDAAIYDKLKAGMNAVIHLN